MQVSNILVEESFRFTEDKPSMLYRSTEIDALDGIVDYCKSINEKVKFSDDLYEIYVQDEVMLADYLFAGQGNGHEDDKRRIMEMLSKMCQYESSQDSDTMIQISLGEYPDCVSNFREYIDYRRFILSGILNVQEYEEFMYSCFPNSCFAKNILSEMRYIEDFSKNVKEITDNLSVLDDEALKLYKEYRTNLKEAMNILTAKLIECSPDPTHVSELLFPFMYEEQINGENVAREKMVVCSPHLKLIRRDSNLRIYFEWCDKDVGKGEKVLIGRIGRHPY